MDVQCLVGERLQTLSREGATTATLASLVASLGLNISDFEGGLNSALSAAQDFQRNLTRISSGAKLINISTAVADANAAGDAVVSTLTNKLKAGSGQISAALSQGVSFGAGISPNLKGLDSVVQSLKTSVNSIKAEFQGAIEFPPANTAAFDAELTGEVTKVRGFLREIQATADTARLVLPPAAIASFDAGLVEAAVIARTAMTQIREAVESTGGGQFPQLTAAIEGTIPALNELLASARQLDVLPILAGQVQEFSAAEANAGGPTTSLATGFKQAAKDAITFSEETRNAVSGIEAMAAGTAAAATRVSTFVGQVRAVTQVTAEAAAAGEAYRAQLGALVEREQAFDAASGGVLAQIIPFINTLDDLAAAGGVTSEVLHRVTNDVFAASDAFKAGVASQEDLAVALAAAEKETGALAAREREFAQASAAANAETAGARGQWASATTDLANFANAINRTDVDLKAGRTSLLLAREEMERLDNEAKTLGISLSTLGGRAGDAFRRISSGGQAINNLNTGAKAATGGLESLNTRGLFQVARGLAFMESASIAADRGVAQLAVGALIFAGSTIGAVVALAALGAGLAIYDALASAQRRVQESFDAAFKSASDASAGLGAIGKTYIGMAAAADELAKAQERVAITQRLAANSGGPTDAQAFIGGALAGSLIGPVGTLIGAITALSIKRHEEAAAQAAEQASTVLLNEAQLAQIDVYAKQGVALTSLIAAGINVKDNQTALAISNDQLRRSVEAHTASVVIQAHAVGLQGTALRDLLSSGLAEIDSLKKQEDAHRAAGQSIKEDETSLLALGKAIEAIIGGLDAETAALERVAKAHQQFISATETILTTGLGPTGLAANELGKQLAKDRTELTALKALGKISVLDENQITRAGELAAAIQREKEALDTPMHRAVEETISRLQLAKEQNVDATKIQQEAIILQDKLNVQIHQEADGLKSTVQTLRDKVNIQKSINESRGTITSLTALQFDTESAKLGVIDVDALKDHLREAESAAQALSRAFTGADVSKAGTLIGPLIAQLKEFDERIKAAKAELAKIEPASATSAIKLQFDTDALKLGLGSVDDLKLHLQETQSAAAAFAAILPDALKAGVAPANVLVEAFKKFVETIQQAETELNRINNEPLKKVAEAAQQDVDIFKAGKEAAETVGKALGDAFLGVDTSTLRADLEKVNEEIVKNAINLKQQVEDLKAKHASDETIQRAVRAGLLAENEALKVQRALMAAIKSEGQGLADAFRAIGTAVSGIRDMAEAMGALSAGTKEALKGIQDVVKGGAELALSIPTGNVAGIIGGGIAALGGAIGVLNGIFGSGNQNAELQKAITANTLAIEQSTEAFQGFSNNAGLQGNILAAINDPAVQKAFADTFAGGGLRLPGQTSNLDNLLKGFGVSLIQVENLLQHFGIDFTQGSAAAKIALQSLAEQTALAAEQLAKFAPTVSGQASFLSTQAKLAIPFTGPNAPSLTAIQTLENQRQLLIGEHGLFKDNPALVAQLSSLNLASPEGQAQFRKILQDLLQQFKDGTIDIKTLNGSLSDFISIANSSADALNQLSTAATNASINIPAGFKLSAEVFKATLDTQADALTKKFEDHAPGIGGPGSAPTGNPFGPPNPPLTANVVGLNPASLAGATFQGALQKTLNPKLESFAEALAKALGLTGAPATGTTGALQALIQLLTPTAANHTVTIHPGAINVTGASDPKATAKAVLDELRSRSLAQTGDSTRYGRLV